MSPSYRITPGIAMWQLQPRAAVPRCAALPQVVSKRFNSKLSASRLNRAIPKTKSLGATHDPTISQAHRASNKDSLRLGNVPLFPITFVPLPFSQYPRSPSDFFAYTWIRLKAWVTSTVSVLQAKLQSQEKWTSRPRWKARRGRIAPTAKAMYRDMLEAFAAGDKETLNRLCTPHFAGKLLAAVDRRPRNERVLFELVRYNKPLFYPRLSSYLIGLFNPLDKYSLREQAIVAIASTQAMSRIHSNQQEKETSKSLKTQDKVEYVVLVRDVDSRTWQSTSWQIWGTTTVTTLQQSRDHQAAMIQQQTKAAGWKQPSGSS